VNEKALTLRDHEVRQVLTTGECLVVRPVKPQPRDPRTNFHFSLDGVWLLERRGYENYAARSEDGMSITCPYPIGSRWWVRETWNARDVVYDEYCGGYEVGYPLNPMPRTRPEYRYVIDFKATDGDEGPWRSPIFMPRWASRITLEVTGVRTERVQDITYDDILAEGWNSRTSEPITDGTAGEDARAWYIALWDSINARRGYPWVSNPWVWVVEFKRIGGAE